MISPVRFTIDNCSASKRKHSGNGILAWDFTEIRLSFHFYLLVFTDCDLIAIPEHQFLFEEDTGEKKSTVETNDCVQRPDTET